MSVHDETPTPPKLKLLKNQLRGLKSFINRLVQKIVPLLDNSITLDEIGVSSLESDIEYLNERIEGMEECFNLILVHPDCPRSIGDEYSEYMLGVKRVVKRASKKMKGENSIPFNTRSRIDFNSTAVDGGQITRQLLAHAKLPALDLPTFQGGENCWREYRAFYEMFQALIDTDPDLTDTLKVQYLRRALRGEALRLVEHIDPVATNYDLYLKTLSDAYQVGQEELNNIIGKLNDINQWQKCQSSKDLFKLLTHVKQYYYLLNQIHPDSTGDIFIVRSIMGLLPDRLGYDIIKKVPVEERTVDKLLSIIQKDIGSYKEGESYGMGKNRYSRQGPFTQNGSRHQRGFRKVMNVQRQHPMCVYCGGHGHNSHYCANMPPVEDCWGILKREWRCFNCLGDDHGAGECRESPQCDCGRGKPHSPSICRDRASPNGAGCNGGNVSQGSFASQNTGGRGRGRVRGKGGGRGGIVDNTQNTFGSVTEGGSHTLSASAQVFEPASQSDRGRARGRGRRGAYFCQGAWGEIFLQTAYVKMRNPASGKTKKVRLILDTACQDSYILESTAQELGCSPIGYKNITVEVFGTDKAVVHRSNVVKVEIIGTNGIIPLELFSIDRLCGSIPGNKVSGEAARQLEGYTLADKAAVHPGELQVHILVGLDQYWDIVYQRVHRSGFGPRLLDTRVGWVLSGAITPISSHLLSGRPGHCYFVSRLGTMEIDEGKCLEDILHRFWDLDSLGIKEVEESPVVRHFNDTVKFDESQKRIEVKIPWRVHLLPYLPYNHRQSLIRENLLQQKFLLERNADYRRKYEETIKKHLVDKVIELVPPQSRVFINNKVGDIDHNNSVVGTSDESHRVLHYIPHHGVLKKGGDKVRIVFDGSSRAYPGAVSLNDCIHPGPSLLTDLSEALMRFRTHSVGLVGDIKGAFHQISLSETDRDAFRFLWHTGDKLEEYRFCRVPFGCTVSPFLLNSTVRAHFKEALKDQPDLYDLVISSLYVDDFLGGGRSVQVVCDLKGLLEKTLGEISMEWHGWMSNCEEVRTLFDIEQVLDHPVLGLNWRPVADTLGINWSRVVDSLEDPKSKRDLLSGTASMWDPLGQFLPVLLSLKLMFQKVCKSKLGWKGKLSPEMRSALLEWNSQLSHLEDVVLPRYVLLEGYDSLEIHGFADASLQAYGAVLYIKSIRGTEIVCNFVVAKNRVAPMKGQTLQRLELMAALLLSRLLKKVLESHKTLEFSRVVLYTDSRDTLYWIKSSNSRWSVFIENRVAEIHELTKTTMWRHVSTDLNPADTLTRPVAASVFAKNQSWFRGPAFLYTNEASSKLELSNLEPSLECLGERRRVAKVVVRSLPIYIIDLDRFSSYFKLIDTTVYVLKFLFKFMKQLSGKVKYNYSSYVRAATNYWVRLEQLAYYPEEVKQCPIGDYVPRVGVHSTNIIRSFRLFKDQEGLLRVSSRIQSELIPWDSRNPVLLPPDSRFTRLYVEMVHMISLHVGYRQTLLNIRRQYLIPRGRHLVRQVISKCVTCKKACGKFYPAPASPALPDFRVSQSDPFTNSGIDFAGPVTVREGSQSRKGYIMVITCASTRAVALELTLGLSVEEMTLGFRRFCARMNTVPSYMISDNFSTFKRAAKELVEVFSSPKMHKYLNGRRIQWQFYVNYCPWWGGFIERMVQTVKKSLRKVVGEARLSYVEFNTILLEIEALINARPITWDYDDPNEPGPISPSDLLYGRSFRQFPPLHEVKVDGLLPQMCRGRVRYLEKLKTHWWDRWRKEYLKDLQDLHTRRKVSNDDREASLGDVVLVRNENVPRGSWRLGKIIEVKPGRDGKIRTARVEVVNPGKRKTFKHSEITRSPTHLVPLEFNTNDNP